MHFVLFPIKLFLCIKHYFSVVSHLNDHATNKVESFSKSVDSIKSEAVKNSIQDKVTDDKKEEDKLFQENINLKNNIQSALNGDYC